MREALFGPLAPLSWDEYKAIYDETGIDIDGRKSMFMNCVINKNFCEHLNEIYVSFFRDIPGFKELHSSDQLNLIMGRKS